MEKIMYFYEKKQNFYICISSWDKGVYANVVEDRAHWPP